MTSNISERAFEGAIESALLRNGPDGGAGGAMAVRESPPAYGDDPVPGGYLKRRPEDYDRGLCLIPADVVDFLSGYPAEGVGEAQAAPRGGSEGALPGPAFARDRSAGGARGAAERRQGLGLQVPAGLLPAGERAE